MVKKNSEEKPSPDKMGEKTGNTEPKQQQRSGKGFTIDVVLLDGQHKDFQLDKNADGRELFDKVCQDLDLQEKEYFGLQYVDERLPHHLKCWLSPDKKISKQKKRGPWLFEFALKFYPPDPTALRESLTKWLVVLQVRRDILSGKLPATFLTQAMLGAYCVQADVGDFDPNDHKGIDYVKDIPFAPNQTPELLEKIAELHKHHKGQTPDEAEGHFLENAKKLAMYGVDLHAAQDVEHVDIMLGVCASGLQVYRDKLRINRFVWPKILKISYKRNHFYIKIRPTDNSQAENNICFKLQSHRLAKRLWKICVEHHAFFRLREADQPQNNAIFPKLGSKFRYSGRTLYQARQKSSDLDRGDPYFERSQPVRSTFAVPAKSQSAENMNRPNFYDDTNVDKKRRSSEKTGEDRRDNKYGDDPTLGGRGKDGAMYDEHGNLIRGPGGKEGEDRRDRLSSNDPTLEREGYGGTAGLTPAQLKQKQKEEEKEKKRKEEEEKKRKKEEERKRKEDEKKNKGGKGEDRRDLKEGDDPTAKKPGYGAGGYGDEHGGDMVAPLGRSPYGKDGDKYGDGRNGEDKYGDDKYGDDRYGDGRFGDGRDKNGYGDGKDGDKFGRDGERWPGREGEDGRRLGPGDEGYDPEHVRFAPGIAVAGEDGDLKYGKDKDKKGRKGSDKDDEKDKDKKGRKGADKDDDKDKKKDDKKSGGLFSKFKKPKSNADDLADGEGAGGRPGYKEGKEGAGKGGFPDGADAGRDKKGGLGYGAGYVPGLGVGAGDMTGVGGEEKWIDNKNRFLPLEPAVKETKSSLKGMDGIDHTMPFFSPAATSTVNRHGKVPPPVPRKMNNSFGDDSFSRTDVYKTDKDGIQETRVEHKVVLSSTDDDFDYDAALAEAIRSVTEFNPDMSVERIECVQQIEDVKGK